MHHTNFGNQTKSKGVVAIASCNQIEDRVIGMAIGTSYNQFPLQSI